MKNCCFFVTILDSKNVGLRHTKYYCKSIALFHISKEYPGLDLIAALLFVFLCKYDLE